jgi:tetratricopeptide (TPR) repeat protein
MPPRPEPLSRALQPLADVTGWWAYCRGNLADAAIAVGQQLRHDEGDGRAWELLGLIRRDAGKTIGAVDAFERAALLVPLQTLSRLCLAESYGMLRRTDLARDLYMLQAEQAAADGELLLRIASGLDGIDHPQLAMDLCRRAATLDPQSGQVAYDMCYYAMRCGCSASTAESLAWRAVELEPDNVDFRIGLASLLVRLDECQRACRVLGRLARENFAAVDCRCCLERIAELYRQAGDSHRHRLCLQRLERLKATTAGNGEAGGAN